MYEDKSNVARSLNYPCLTSDGCDDLLFLFRSYYTDAHEKILVWNKILCFKANDYNLFYLLNSTLNMMMVFQTEKQLQ